MTAKKIKQPSKGIGRNKKYIYGGFFTTGVIALWFVTPFFFSVSYTSGDTDTETADNQEISAEVPGASATPIYLETPKPLKSIYMTSCVVGTPSFRDELVRIAEATEVNSIVIDIKDYSGGISFVTDNPVLSPYISDRCRAPDMKEFVRKLNDKGIYVIGRVTVFQDPLYTLAHPDSAVERASNGNIW